MIALDTNVLVRLLVDDDAAQAGRARRLLDELAATNTKAWVSDGVLLETVWTLARAYERQRGDLALAVRALRSHDTVQLESAAAVTQALALFEASSSDFADCLLAPKAGLAGCEAVVTFDKGMRRMPKVRVL